MDAELSEALDCVKALEEELQQAFADHNPRVLQRTPMKDASWFLLGAIKRLTAQSAGFCRMIEDQNFPSATALLRMQLDTAMRLNGLRYVSDREDACKFLMTGGKFSTLKATDGSRLRDSKLKELLAVDHPWIEGVYDEASGYVHLSGEHMKSAVGAVINGRVFFNLGAKDPTNYLNRHLAVTRAFFASMGIGVEIIYVDLELLTPEEFGAARNRRAGCRPEIEKP